MFVSLTRRAEEKDLIFLFNSFLVGETTGLIGSKSNKTEWNGDVLSNV